MTEDNLRDFAGRTALVTGGSSGLGACVVARLRAAGARVRHCGLSHAVADDPDYHAVDVRDDHALQRFVDQAADDLGGLDYAVNGAGISHPSARLADMDPEAFRTVMETNAFGVFHAMRHELRHMQARGAGAIVNVASTLSRRGAPWVSAYGASKHAIVGLTQSAAAEYGPMGIRINAVSPGPMDTPMFARAMADIAGDMSKYAGGLPDAGPASPAQMAELILFVLSARGAYLNGANLVADGGTSAT